MQSDYGAKEDAGGQGGLAACDSTNLSYLGVRGQHPVQPDLNFVWQLEAGIDISATPGIKETTSNTSYAVNGALFSRNSFVGLAGKDWGSVMIGKSETPYKTSTDRLNPFSGMLGDYRVMIGNSGGDNRVEFGLAPRTPSGTSRRLQRLLFQGDVLAWNEPAITPAASFRPPSRIARAATSREAAHCHQPATTGPLATSIA